MELKNNARTVLFGLAAILLMPVASVAAISSQVVCLNGVTGIMVVKNKCSGKERAFNLNMLIASAAVKGPAGAQGVQGPAGAQGPQGESGDVAAILGPKTAADVVTIDSLNAGSNLCQGNGTFEGRFVVYTVPSSKSLIITEATVTGAGAVDSSQIGEQLGGALEWKVIGSLFKTSNTSWQYSSNIGVSFAPGSTVIITCYDTNAAGQNHYAWHLTGYLAD
jgi:hypothetical protein